MKNCWQLLKELKDDWNDEIPEKIIHSDSTNKRFKARTSWFQGLIAILEIMVIDGEINNRKIITEIESFSQKIKSRDWDQTRTTKKEIGEANNLINKVLKLNKYQKGE